MAAAAASTVMSHFGGPGEGRGTTEVALVGSAVTWAESGLSVPAALTAATMK